MRATKPQDRLIVAIDTPNIEMARSIWIELRETISFFRLSSDIMLASGSEEFVREIKDNSGKVLADTQGFQSSDSLSAELKRLEDLAVDGVILRCHPKFLGQAIAYRKKASLVTPLLHTGIGVDDWKSVSAQTSIQALLERNAELALKTGLNGIITSGVELPQLRRKYGSNFIAIVPGIRDQNWTPSHSDFRDNQKRTVTVEEAFGAGADYIIIGRPITLAEDRIAVADSFLRRVRVAPFNAFVD